MTIEEVLEVNKNISMVLRNAVESQLSLRNKLQDALSTAGLTGPTGPTEPSPIRTYSGNLSTSGSSIKAPLGNGIIYQIQYSSSSVVSLYFVPSNGAAYINYRIVSHYDST